VNSTNPEAQSDGAAEKEPRSSRHGLLRWRLLAAVCSAIVPGAGQWLLHQRARAVVYWILVIGVIALWWPLRLPMTFWGWVLAIAATCLLWIVSAVEALLDVGKSSWRARALWLAIVVPLALVVAALLCEVLLHAAGMRLYHDPSSGMASTIAENERVMVDVRDIDAHTGAPVVFERDSITFVKRVIGMPGNVVEGKNGNVSVNGAQLKEPYVQHAGLRLQNLDNFGPISVPQGRVFVLGDNRDFSLDSRMPDFGTVPIATLSGKPLYVVSSRSPLRIGKTIR